jgi:3-dehydroquinate dehydratase type I
MGQITSKEPDLIEFRLDRLHQRKLLGDVVRKKPCKLIATDRSDRSQARKMEELSNAATLGFDYVDLDFSTTNPAAVKQLKSQGVQVILSAHDYSRTPSREELSRILQAEKRLGGDICKLVTTARMPRDNLTILSFVESEATNTKLVSFAMGKEGVASRILSPLFGAQFTFASLSRESSTADGQLTIDELRSAWRILGI